MIKTAPPSPRRHIYSVSELTGEIKEILEDALPFVWVAGEISNFSTPSSGHHYFTLKDEGANLSAVMFRGQNRNLTFSPGDGMAVLAMGRINVYEPRGTYQIIVEYLEPSGTGALQLAFEQLKERLQEEGLFDASKKRPLPFLPALIGVVTSPTGAAVRDILNVTHRRFPNMPVQIAPVKVQGEGSAEEIAAAIDIFNQRKETDVIIVARGGGSLEDLQAFNSEIVARAIADSNIPVVSAVGHETDFTICDFVADMRAPTPSAGAEIVVPEKSDVINYLVHTQERVSRTIRQQLSTLRQRLVETERRLVAPEKRLIDLRLRLDDFVLRAQRAQHTLLKTQVERHGLALKRLCLSGPHVHVEKLKKKLEYCNKTLSYTMRFRMDSWQHAFQVALGKLNAMNPLSVLERGYSVTRTWPKGELVRTTDQVGENQQVSVTLSHGSLVCRVEEIEENDKAEDV